MGELHPTRPMFHREELWMYDAVHMVRTGGAGYIYAMIKPQRLLIREVALFERETF